MKLKFISVILTATLALGGCASDKVKLETSMNISNKDKAISVLNSIETGDTKAISYINAEQYTQHNLAVADGLAGFGEVLQALPKGSAKVNVVRAFEDSEYVFLHTEYNFFGPKAGFDLFRFADGKIVEHWDNLDVIAKPNPSGRTQFDGSTELTDLDKTEENKALVADFVDSILVKGQLNKLSTFIDGENYLQHNTAMADGLSGLAVAFKAMAEHGITMAYNQNHKVLGQGNFVLTISEGEFAGKPTSFYDLFRVENSKIVEHWDVIETILPKEQWKNTNGKFGNL